MDKIQDKKAKNREHYLKNRDKLSARARARYHEKKGRRSGSNVIPFPGAKPPSKKRISRRKNGRGIGDFLSSILEPLALGILITASTYFLMRETALFLAQNDGTGAAWLKAALGEAMILALSCVRVQGWTHQSSRAILLTALFVYQEFAIIGGVWTEGVHKTAASENAKQEVSELEQSIAQKEILRAEYHDSRRLTLSRKYEQQISRLREKLSQARSQLLKNPGDGLKTESFMFGFFRLLLMLSNSFLLSYFSVTWRRRAAPVLRLRLC